MNRLDTIKRVGFPEEVCPKCQADVDDCEACNGTGKFKQRVKANWQYPNIQPGCRLVAYLDWDEWASIAVFDAHDNLVDELEFPFDTDFATAQHFRTLGFEVEQ